MRSLILLAALAAGPALADYILKTDGGYVRLQDAPCKHQKVLDLIKPEFHAQFRQGFVVFQGRNIEACWIVEGEGVTIIDAEGDAGTVPQTAFKKMSGV